jgi:hypothetical protein
MRLIMESAAGVNRASKSGALVMRMMAWPRSAQRPV